MNWKGCGVISLFFRNLPGEIGKTPEKTQSGQSVLRVSFELEHPQYKARLS
jgi:hypothetical protein